jgi:hypothetical protein
MHLLLSSQAVTQPKFKCLYTMSNTSATSSAEKSQTYSVTDLKTPYIWRKI